MQRLLMSAAVTLAVSPLVRSQTQPNFRGVWTLQELQPGQAAEVLHIDHQEPQMPLIYAIADRSGKRTLDLSVMTDGKEHPQDVQALPATFMATWEGEALIVEIKRQAPFGLVHNRRVVYLGAADNVAGPLPSRLREVTAPVVRTRNPLSSPHRAR